jgi:hypothetical protein
MNKRSRQRVRFIVLTTAMLLALASAGARVANGQAIQYSGTADPASLKLTTDTPQRVAGKWDLDASGAGGPVIRVEFDATAIKEIKGRGRRAAKASLLLGLRSGVSVSAQSVRWQTTEPTQCFAPALETATSQSP